MIEIVGLPAAGWAGLGSVERDLIERADLVVGARRQLGLLPPRSGQPREAWPSDLRGALPGLLAEHATRRIVVLASGDPLVAGVGATVIDVFGAADVRVHPAVSSVALARARLGWSEGSYDLVRLRGDDLDVVRRVLYPGHRVLVLARDADTPAELAALLVDADVGSSQLTVLGDLGAAGESRRTGTAAGWTGASPALAIVAVEVRADSAIGSWSLAPGLPDAAYDHDGQLTKQPLRALALAQLMPRPGGLLWDVGAGAGSVAVEWARSHRTCRAVAVEREPARAKRIGANAARLGVPGVQVVLGEAPAALAGLPQPDAVFVGGGGSTQVTEQAWSALPPGGRLVWHAVTTETEAELLTAWRRFGGEVSRHAVERLEPLGRYSGWKPARAVVTWTAVKP